MNVLTDAATTSSIRVWRCAGSSMVSVSGVLDAAGIQELERQFASTVASGVLIGVQLSRTTVANDSLREVLAGMDRLLRAFGGRLVVLRDA